MSVICSCSDARAALVEWRWLLCAEAALITACLLSFAYTSSDATKTMVISHTPCKPR
jgi:hypothetical protein